MDFKLDKCELNTNVWYEMYFDGELVCIGSADCIRSYLYKVCGNNQSKYLRYLYRNKIDFILNL